MPKIDAPTVAEHHRRRRRALLDAAERLLAESGVEAVTIGAVGAQAGLARSSVYQYFDSAPALIAALVEDLMPRSLARLDADTAAAADPMGRVDAFVRSALSTTTDTTHRALSALADADLPAECTARLAELHLGQQAPLRAALADLGAPDPGLTADLVMGLIEGATRAVVHGAGLDEVTARTLALVHGGLRATGPGPGSAAGSRPPH